MIARITSFALTPRASAPSIGDAHRLRTPLPDRLRREHVRDFGGADAERERADRAVRGRVAVAAHDEHARLRQPLLGRDDVHDALARIVDAEHRDAAPAPCRRASACAIRAASGSRTSARLRLCVGT